MAEETKKPISNKVKIPVIVLSAIIGLIVVAVIVLSCVRINPLKDFASYDTVIVTDEKGSNLGYCVDASEKKDFDKALKKGYTVMHALMEFVYSYKPKFATKDGEKETKTIDEAKQAVTDTATNYVVRLNFEKTKSIKVEDEKVTFDTVIFSVYSTANEIQTITVYAFEDYGEQNHSDDEYFVTPIKVRANLTPLYNVLTKIAEKRRAW